MTVGSGKIEGFVIESENYKAENFKKFIVGDWGRYSDSSGAILIYERS